VWSCCKYFTLTGAEKIKATPSFYLGLEISKHSVRFCFFDQKLKAIKTRELRDHIPSWYVIYENLNGLHQGDFSFSGAKNVLEMKRSIHFVAHNMPLSFKKKISSEFLNEEQAIFSF